MRDRRGLGAADVAALDNLVRDLAAFASRAGARGVDPTQALRRVGPAAYLRDGHLSAAEHDAVAGALSAPR